MNRPALATTALTALLLTGCTTPGWEGTGTAIEIEFLQPEREANTVDADALEITVMLGNGQEANAQFNPTQDCAEHVVLGRNYTLADIEEHCGPAEFSTDD